MSKNNYTNYWKRFQKIGLVLFLGLSVFLSGVDSVSGQEESGNIDENIFAEVISDQHADDDDLMSIQFTNVTLKGALELFAERLSVGFSYNPDIMPDKKVNFGMSNVPAHEIIYKLLEGTNLEPVLPPTRDVIILMKKEAKIEFDALQETITGTVIDAETGEAIPGVNIAIEGTTMGTTTSISGTYELEVPSLEVTLVYSYIGYESQLIEVDGRTEINVSLIQEIIAGDELVVVGYGIQKRSDVTGSVASIPRERLEMSPNQNLSQAIQGAIPGVMVQTTSSGAAPDESIMVRGRNSIAAANDPLIVVDGVPYGGNLSDINPNDIDSIEVLKDASAAAIYGSRGSNGVILISTNQGVEGSPRFSYEGKFTTQRIINFPNLMDGGQFWEFKNERAPGSITNTEERIYNSGEWTDWADLGLRNGARGEHNFSVSGGFENLNYYVSGNFLGVEGLMLGDDYQRLTGRVNLDIDITDWLSIGTRTTASESDRSGVAADIQWGGVSAGGLLFRNPLTPAFDDEGNILTTPWPEDGRFGNPLSPTTHDNVDNTFQFVTNNFVLIEFPFLNGLSNRVNTGIRQSNSNFKEYIPRTTWFGDGAHQGFAHLENSEISNFTFENILNYNFEFAQHSIFATAVYSYEKNSNVYERTDASVFPNDLLSWNAIGQAGSIQKSFDYPEIVLMSQMLRLNYSYDSRYLLTLTTRRDGFSGFGEDSKWGIFPSVALAWNLTNETFFPWAETFSEFKPRISYGINGNQAVSPFSTIASFRDYNTLSNGVTQPGFVPSSLANQQLGWESSTTINLGLDLGLYEDRITGTIDFYRTNTTDLLLERAIASTHGFSSILQNIGETKNQGLDFSLQSRNVVSDNFSWSTQANFSYVKNEIVELFGDGRDDQLNNWYIGQPIRVNYDYVYGGVWQSDEADQAAQWGVEPGNVRIVDITGDGQISGDDRQIIGQIDPDVLWGLSNSFRYKNFTLNVFVHGAHGATKQNIFKNDYVWETVSRNIVNLNFWSPENPTNDFWANRFGANTMGGVDMNERFYESADFVRIRDITLGYNLPANIIDRVGVNQIRVYATVRNLHTFTNYGGLDPELDVQSQGPLPREMTLGFNIDF